MTVTIGHLSFDHATYDERGDVLYLRVGERQAAAASEETPEGHVLRFDGAGTVIGLTIINAKWLLEQKGAIDVTVPEHVSVAGDALTTT
jgi:uncharacterized protein YuzE